MRKPQGCARRRGTSLPESFFRKAERRRFCRRSQHRRRLLLGSIPLRSFLLSTAVCLGLTSAMRAVHGAVAQVLGKARSTDRTGPHQTSLPPRWLVREGGQPRRWWPRHRSDVLPHRQQRCCGHCCHRYAAPIRVTQAVTSVTGVLLVPGRHPARRSHRDTDVSDVTVRSAPMFARVTRRYDWIRFLVTDKMISATGGA